MSLQLVADYDSDADEQLRKSTFAEPDISDSDDDDDDDVEAEQEAEADAHPARACQDPPRLPSEGTLRLSSMQQKRRESQEKGIPGLPTASFLFKEVHMSVCALRAYQCYANVAALPLSRFGTP